LNKYELEIKIHYSPEQTNKKNSTKKKENEEKRKAT
jgi:hypothetical protein